MEFDTLKLFLAVAEHGSFTRAGIKLGITQPAIGRRVQRLEEEIGVPLFYRHGRGVSLTQAGEKLEGVAKHTFDQLDATCRELATEVTVLRGAVTIGLPPSLGCSLALRLTRAFQKRFPESRLQIVEAFSGTLLDWLEAGEIDLGVLYDARRTPTMLVEPLLHEDLYLVERPCGSDVREVVPIGELGSGPFTLSSASNGLRRVVEAAAVRSGVSVNVSSEVDSLSALKQFAEQGPERCILPFGAIHREVAEGRLRARHFEAPGLGALLVSATPSHRPVTRLSKATRQLLVEEVVGAVKEGILSGTLPWQVRDEPPVSAAG